MSITIPAFAGQGIELAAVIEAEIKALPVRNTSALRAVRRKYSRILQEAPAEFILQLARELCKTEAYRWIAYELILGHRAAFKRLGPTELEELGQGINSWWSVDAFARTLSGPAWLRGQVSDQLIIKWAISNDRWWRRAALVSTVALNVRSQEARGMWCGHCKYAELASDQEDMVAKALSWALRELVVHDAGAVKLFLDEHDKILAARSSEVSNKLRRV